MMIHPDPQGDLPSFARPPVTEVVLSIQCASIPGFRAIHAGLLWQEFRAIYPKVSEQPPLGQVFETFGSTLPAGMPFRMEAFMTPPMPRFWFEGEEGSGHLLQVQQDRFVHNWRKQNNEMFYPRYEPIRDSFLDEMNTISAFLAQERLGPIQPNQCEVSYTNVIVLPDGADPHVHLERITPLWNRWQHDKDLAPLESASITARYLMRSDEIPIGRVYVDFQPARLVIDASPTIKLEITVRGKPRENNIESAFLLLDAERRAVVRTFDRVTSKELHAVWGKVNVG
jgi:uncharacterized protein (TIGR04255 family)